MIGMLGRRDRLSQREEGGKFVVSVGDWGDGVWYFEDEVSLSEGHWRAS